MRWERRCRRSFRRTQYAQVRLAVSQTFFLEGRPLALGNAEKTPAGVAGRWRWRRCAGQRPRIPFDWSRLRLRCSRQSMISGCWIDFLAAIDRFPCRTALSIGCVSRLAGGAGGVVVGLVGSGIVGGVAGFTGALALAARRISGSGCRRCFRRMSWRSYSLFPHQDFLA